MPKRGRPQLTDDQAAQMAANIIEAATALRYYPARFSSVGTIARDTAVRYIFANRGKYPRRFRGKVGKYLGDTLAEIFPKPNLTAYAVSLVLDHGLTTYRASKLTGIDATNLGRALKSGRTDRALRQKRIAALNTQVTSANLLPENTIT